MWLYPDGSNGIVIENGGAVGILKAPEATYELDVNGDIRGTTVTQGSSRTIKRDIRALTADDAWRTLLALTPTRYRYRANPTDEHVGFIAEDVPDLVATEDRKSLNPMDIVAVLTKVVQLQQERFEQQRTVIAAQKRRLTAQDERLRKFETRLQQLEARLVK